MPVRLTKIIATLGPATGNKVAMKTLVKAGVNVFRLNLSHGRHDVVRQWIRWIREVEKEVDIFVGVLLDLQGPKIRVGSFKEGAIDLKRGQQVVFTTERVVGNGSLVPVQYRRFHKEVSPGNQVYLDDGNLCVEVLGVSGPRVKVEVKVGGRLSDFKGINMPDASLSKSPLTPKDKQDLKFGLKEGIDFVALSFAGSGKDIRQLRRLISSEGKDVEIIAKIERKQAIENLDEIIQAADAIMVARGDLGVEIPLAEVPVVQQRILRNCARHSKPVIIATQMLESMINNPRPTRAEVSDVSNSVMYCADAIMLSAETAVGKYPKKTVEVMVETILHTESYQKKTQRILPWRWFFDKSPPINLGISYSANRMVELLNAQALLVFTLSGGTSKMIASAHPMVPLFAFTAKKDQARRLAMLRGAVPFLVKESENFLNHIDDAFRLLKKKHLVKKGDRIVIATGIPVAVPKWTNVIRVEVVP